MGKKFIKAIVPAMISLLVSGIYMSIDGLFIGQAVGDAGLASLNIAWPLAAIIFSTGTGIGMGGAVNISNYMGANKKEKADRALGNTILLLFITSILITIFLFLWTTPMLKLLGAEGQVLELGQDYIGILGMGCILQIFGTGVVPLLRNQGKAWTAMVLLITNFVLDTVLSGVFVLVLGYGVAGAAIATLIGQGIALVPSLWILFKKENRVSITHYVLEKKMVQSILKIGMSPFALSFLPSIAILLINWQALTYGGTNAVAAYAVSSYVVFIGEQLLQGIRDGSQPLISFYYGANDYETVHKLRKWTYGTSIFAGSLVTLILILLRNAIPVIYGVSAETAGMLHVALPLFAISLPFYAFSRATTSYFYAIKESRRASLMVYGEVLIALPLCSFVLPKVFGITGVWITFTSMHMLLVLASSILLKRKNEEMSLDLVPQQILQ